MILCKNIIHNNNIIIVQTYIVHSYIGNITIIIVINSYQVITHFTLYYSFIQMFLSIVE